MLILQSSDGLLYCVIAKLWYHEGFVCCIAHSSLMLVSRPYPLKKQHLLPSFRFSATPNFMLAMVQSIRNSVCIWYTAAWLATANIRMCLYCFVLDFKMLILFFHMACMLKFLCGRWFVIRKIITFLYENAEFYKKGSLALGNLRRTPNNSNMVLKNSYAMSRWESSSWYAFIDSTICWNDHRKSLSLWSSKSGCWWYCAITVALRTET